MLEDYKAAVEAKHKSTARKLLHDATHSYYNFWSVKTSNSGTVHTILTESDSRVCVQLERLINEHPRVNMKYADLEYRTAEPERNCYSGNIAGFEWQKCFDAVPGCVIVARRW